ncbi:hypothetical protein Csa_023494 [Cucumis sativus]|nr:hypothetical protein Csa_023494 [Cucumis sativus]
MKGTTYRTVFDSFAVVLDVLSFGRRGKADANEGYTLSCLILLQQKEEKKFAKVFAKVLALESFPQFDLTFDGGIWAGDGYSDGYIAF